MERKREQGVPEMRGTRASAAGDGAPRITCPKCRRTSYNPNDISTGYCGHCHEFTGALKLVKPEMPEPPRFMRDLPVDPKRGYLVPWFVKWIDGQPEFRVMDRDKFWLAVKEKRCWVCGKSLYAEHVFTIGPMCAINRISSEPPSHRECAQYSARVCPFLSKPQMTRRPIETDEQIHVAGIMIERNPGVTLLYYTKRYRILKVNDGVLFQLGRAFKVEWFREGREATRAEVMESMRTGLPALEKACDLDLDPAVAKEELKVQLKKALVLVPRQ
jgi:hypothetical protein